MSREKDFFDSQIAELSGLTSIYRHISQQGGFSGAEHILRAEYSLIVSAFDNYLHGVVRRKLGDAFFSSESAPETLKLDMKIREFHTIIHETNAEERKQLFDSALRKRLAEDSFQSPQSVEYALGLIEVKNLWKKAASELGGNVTPQTVRNQLALIVHRRNQIAHESDIDPISLVPREIDIADVAECRNFLTKLVACADSLIEEGN